MRATAIYVRTAKGADEVARRSQAISSKVRSLLLLIDGKLTGAQLIDKFAAFPNSAEYLQQLEDAGYIEAQDTGSASLVAPVSATAASVVSQAGLGDAKRLVVQTLHEMLGPEADYLAANIETALTAAELRVYAERYRDMLVDMGKPKKAAAFWQAFEALLPPG